MVKGVIKRNKQDYKGGVIKENIYKMFWILLNGKKRDYGYCVYY